METLKYFNEEPVERIGKYIIQGKAFLEIKDGDTACFSEDTMDDVYIIYKLLNKNNDYLADYVIDILEIYDRVTIFVKIKGDGKLDIVDSYAASGSDVVYVFKPITAIDLLRQELRLERAFSVIENDIK